MTGSIAGLERFDSPGKGRALRVTRPFKVGELLFSCPAYSFVLSVKERGCCCEFCFTRKEGLARCGKCKKAFYCNAKCQKGDWSMHKLECSAMNAFQENWCPSETSRLVARILAKKKMQRDQCASEKMMLIGEMQSRLEESVLSETPSDISIYILYFWIRWCSRSIAYVRRQKHFLTFGRIRADVEDEDNEKRERTEADIAGLHRFYSKHVEFPDHKDLLTLFSQVACNGFTIEDDELSHIGTAVYPDVALINHSCLPSVIVTYNGTSAEIRAVQDMKPGDEVLISYIDLLYPTDDRNNRLRDFYYFTCDCLECKNRSKDKAKLKVRKQSDPIELQVINNMVRYARKTIKEFRELKHVKTPSELLEMCEQSLEEMGSVFDDSNVYMLHMMYQAMGVCIYMQDADGAISYGEKILKPFSILYPPYSLNVSSMYLKMGRIYMQVDRRSAGINALKKAIAIMEVAHGKDHHYLTELRKEIAQK